MVESSVKGARGSLGATGVVCLAALLSGAAGLSYEVVWSRMLVVPLGNSSDATALVLCSFMLGMALGARFMGALADKLASPFKVYVAAELALAAYAVAVPFVEPAILGNALPWVIKMIIGAVLVAIPALLMGASIPVLVRGLSKEGRDVPFNVGLIYGMNTLGGAGGAALAGFVAIPSLGLTASSFLAAAASAAAALLVLAVVKLGKGEKKRERSWAALAQEEMIVPRITAVSALAAAGAGGFVMLGAEVIWARLLTFVFGHDTYAFATLLVVVLAGLGIGGALHRVLAKRDPAKLTWLFLGLLLVSFYACYQGATHLVVAFGRDPFALGSTAALSTSLWTEFYRELLFTPILVLLPSVFAGALLPAACSLYAGGERGVGRRVGTALLVNGIAAAAGSLITSLVLIPTAGIQSSAGLLIMAGALGIAPMTFLAEKGKRRTVAQVLLFVSAASVFLAMTAGPQMPKAMLQEAVGERHQEIIHYEEGRTGTVSVTVNTINDERQLFMNAVNEVTTRLVHDQSFKLLGHLGPLLHEDPKRGLMICLGAGLSAGAALTHPFEQVDVVELSSSIPAATQRFSDINGDVLNDPRLRVHIDDGRRYLLDTEDRFDVVMVDSTHPKSVDSWILYTHEFYDLVESRLDDDGIFVQWLPLHGLSEREFKIIVRTFKDVFANTTLWVNVGYETYGQVAYLKLVGAKEPLQINYKELAMRLKEPRIKRDLEPYGMDGPEEILDCFLAGSAAVDNWTQGLPIQTDDRPFLPYITEHSTGRRMEPALLLGVRSNINSMLSRMGDREAEIIARLNAAHEAQGFLLAGFLQRAAKAYPEGRKIELFEVRSAMGRDYYRELAKLYDDDSKKLFEIGSYLGNLGHPGDAVELYDSALGLSPEDRRVIINRALALVDMGELEAAEKDLARMVDQEPEDALAHYNLGAVLLQRGSAKGAVSEFKEALELNPELHGARISLAEAYRSAGMLKKAEAQLRDLTQRARWLPEAWDMLGLIEGERGEWERAKELHAKALHLDPYRAETHYNMGIALQEEGRLKAAAQAYSAALRIQPKDAEAHNNLGLVYAAAGLMDKAVEHHRQALEIEPHYPEAAFNLGLAYKAMGLLLQAAEAFTVAFQLAPELTQAKEQLDLMGISGARFDTEDAGMPEAVDGGPDSG